MGGTRATDGLPATCPSCACCPRPRRWPRRPPRRSRRVLGRGDRGSRRRALGRRPAARRRRASTTTSGGRRSASASTGRASTSGGATTGSCPTDHPLSNVLPLDQILLATGGDEETGARGADVGEPGRGRADPGRATPRGPGDRGDRPFRRCRVGGCALRGGDRTGGTRGRPERAIPCSTVLIMGVGPGRPRPVGLPGLRGLGRDGATVVAVPAPTHVEPHVDRVTLHPRLIAAARRGAS